VAIDPIALLADGLPVTTSLFTPTGLADRHPGVSLRHQGDSAGLVSAACMTTCNEHGICKHQNNHGCSLHHHPAFVAADSTFDPMTRLDLNVFGLNTQMPSHEIQPETPPPKCP